MATTRTAYSLYHYLSGGSGMAGRITDNGTTVAATFPKLTSALNGDPLVEGFNLGGQRIAVTQRVAGSAQPTAIYNAASGGAAIATPTWANVINPYGLEPLGSRLYALDFDGGKLVEINGSSPYAATGVIFDFNTNPVTAPLVPSGMKAHGQAVLNIGGALYGLFIIADTSFTTYANSVLVRFSITGGSSITVAPNDYNNGFEKNSFQMAVSGSELFVAAIGGVQSNTGYNTNSKIQKVTYGASPLSGAPVTTVLSASASYPYEFRGISFKGSTAFILAGRYDASWNLMGDLRSTTNFTTFTTIDSFSGSLGYYWAAQYTTDNDRLWYARGNEIRVINASTLALVQALTITTTGAGRLMEPGDQYTNLNDMSYVSPTGLVTRIRGYQSPTQISATPRAAAARAIAKGRPELLPEEWEEVEAQLSKQ
ncbi:MULTISPECIES: hypothetical protein [unclassified Sphingobium]|uniref:hypothetical protein n=1 Tax=unclassified Sphingobium TaxID=2611147 RepID=UPI001198D75F|nr:MULTISPECIES: hypothetical protein [unclassified Sphingobium]MBG6116599.1 hypothetical protein [Sphingobium sp. JAI105]TWD07213.1 hypothetical protein FB595_107163 [Sphingobium sp. AEW010]TWD24338.1 hypothetical protein FB596_10710 [Sphingobium sp. AEW013]TWD26169.1 hypothetical protein FB594_10710 [Sphingobium sp. AEW001]